MGKLSNGKIYSYRCNKVVLILGLLLESMKEIIKLSFWFVEMGMVDNLLGLVVLFVDREDNDWLYKRWSNKLFHGAHYSYEGEKHNGCHGRAQSSYEGEKLRSSFHGAHKQVESSINDKIWSKTWLETWNGVGWNI